MTIGYFFSFYKSPERSILMILVYAFGAISGCECVFIVILFFIIILVECIKLCRPKGELAPVASIFETVKNEQQKNKRVSQNCNCNCSCDCIRPDGDDDHENGITNELATLYVKGLVKAYEFGRNNSMIRNVMDRNRRLLCPSLEDDHVESESSINMEAVKELSQSSKEPTIRSLSCSPSHCQ